MLLFIAVKVHWRAATGICNDSTIAYAPLVSVLESRTAIRSPAVPSYQGPSSVGSSRPASGDDLFSLTTQSILLLCTK